MSSQSISPGKCFLNEIHEGAYNLSLETPFSKHNIIFKCGNSADEGSILDIYSQNGIARKSNFLNKLFSQEDKKGLISSSKKYQSSGITFSAVVLVLDLKDGRKSYANLASIQASEQKFCAFVQQDVVDHLEDTASQVHQLFRERLLPCDFVICEGSLKHELLKRFSSQEQEWFLKTREGAIALCQYAEYHMNGFKFGHEADEIHAEKFIIPVSSQSAFKPRSQSTVWYPELYKEIYSLESEFAKSMAPVFSLSGAFDTTSRITSVTAELL